MSQIVAITNQKGGVGNTTFANIGAGLARAGTDVGQASAGQASAAGVGRARWHGGQLGTAASLARPVARLTAINGVVDEIE